MRIKFCWVGVDLRTDTKKIYLRGQMYANYARVDSIHMNSEIVRKLAMAAIWVSSPSCSNCVFHILREVG